MNTSADYTTEAETLVDALRPIYPNSLMNIKIETDIKPSSNFVWTDLIPLGWRISFGAPPKYKEGFIDILIPKNSTNFINPDSRFASFA